MENENNQSSLRIIPWEELSDPGMDKYFDASINALSQFNEQLFFVIQSEHDAINGLQVMLQRGERCFEFVTESLHPKSNSIENRHVWKKSIVISGSIGTFRLPNGFGEFGFDLTPPKPHAKGVIWDLECIDKKNTHFFRYMVEHKDYMQNRANNYLEIAAFNPKKWVFPDLHIVTCNDIKYHFYECQVGNKFYHFIDAIEKVSLEEFEKAVNCVHLSFGFISGFIPRDERFIFQSSDIAFKRISGFHYKRLSDTIKRGISIVNESWMKQFHDNKELAFVINMRAFSNLVNHAYANIQFRRALQLVVDANPLPMNIRASTYYVALETIRNIIVSNTPSLKPIENKQFFQELRAALMEVVMNLPDDKFNDRETILERIRTINQPLNKKGFIQLFEHFNFKLNESDLEALEMRNDLLHGRLPYESSDNAKEPDTKENFEIGKIENEELIFFTFKVRFLISVLVMSYSDFSGYLLHLPRVVKYKGRHKDNQEPKMRFI